jgi:hypothetical protein
MTADGGLFIDNALLARMMEDLTPEQRGILEREAIRRSRRYANGKVYPTKP